MNKNYFSDDQFDEILKKCENKENQAESNPYDVYNSTPGNPMDKEDTQGDSHNEESLTKKASDEPPHVTDTQQGKNSGGSPDEKPVIISPVHPGSTPTEEPGKYAAVKESETPTSYVAGKNTSGENIPTPPSSYSAVPSHLTEEDRAFVGGATPTGRKKERPVTRKTLVSVVVICVAASLIVGILGGMLAYNVFSKGTPIIYQTDSSVDTNGSANVGDGKSLADVAAAAANSVVEISTETAQTSSYMRQYVTQGAGSGVIISEDGYIITNNHVISGANKISIRTKDSKTYDAKLVGNDSTTDVALLKVEATGLTPAVFGDSSTLSVGDTAVAIGNPLGELGGTVTTGIISALDREITIDGNNMTLLQTDAAINPGNSGGGLFNSNGNLIGIVVAKSSGTDVEGLGFAIPINNVKSVFEDLSSYGYVKGRPQLGVSLVDVNSAQAARQYGVTQMGVYVYSVAEGAGAQQAGIKSGDLVQAIDGTAVASSTEIKSIISKHNVGDTINLSIVREGKQQSISVTLTESTSG